MSKWDKLGVGFFVCAFIFIVAGIGRTMARTAENRRFNHEVRLAKTSVSNFVGRTGIIDCVARMNCRPWTPEDEKKFQEETKRIRAAEADAGVKP